MQETKQLHHLVTGHTAADKGVAASDTSLKSAALALPSCLYALRLVAASEQTVPPGFHALSARHPEGCHWHGNSLQHMWAEF